MQTDIKDSYAVIKISAKDLSVQEKRKLETMYVLWDPCLIRLNIIQVKITRRVESNKLVKMHNNYQ